MHQVIMNQNNGIEFEERVKQFYLNDQGVTYHLKKRKLSPELIPWIARLRSDKIQPYVHENEDVFEFGAGAGWNLINLKCKSKTAYDLSTLNLATFEKHQIKFISEIEQFPTNHFDVVICHHVLEHVPYPGITLSIIRNVLKPNGKLILVVPFETQHLTSYDSKDREGHLYSWVPQTLVNLVERAGFKHDSISVRKTGYDRFAAEKAKQLKLGEAGFRILRNIGHLINPHKENFLVAHKI